MVLEIDVVADVPVAPGARTAAPLTVEVLTPTACLPGVTARGSAADLAGGRVTTASAACGARRCPLTATEDPRVPEGRDQGTIGALTGRNEALSDRTSGPSARATLPADLPAIQTRAGLGHGRHRGEGGEHRDEAHANSGRHHCAPPRPGRTTVRGPGSGGGIQKNSPFRSASTQRQADLQSAVLTHLFTQTNPACWSAERCRHIAPPRQALRPPALQSPPMLTVGRSTLIGWCTCSTRTLFAGADASGGPEHATQKHKRMTGNRLVSALTTGLPRSQVRFRRRCEPPPSTSTTTTGSLRNFDNAVNA